MGISICTFNLHFSFYLQYESLVLLVRPLVVEGLGIEEKLLKIKEAKAQNSELPKFPKVEEYSSSLTVVCPSFSIQQKTDGSFSCHFNTTSSTNQVDLCDEGQQLYLEMWSSNGSLVTSQFSGKQCCDQSTSFGSKCLLGSANLFLP